jgi:hypothetical protein
MADEAEVLLEGMDENNISSILETWKNLDAVKKDIDKKDQMLRDKIKAFMKEHNWEKMKDEKTNIGVTITVSKREDIDKEQLKIMLTPQQYAQVAKISTFEQMRIITPEARARMQKMFNKGPKL